MLASVVRGVGGGWTRRPVSVRAEGVREAGKEASVTEKQERWALFWCGLLHDVLFGDPDAKEVRRHLRELSKKEALFPNGKRRRPSLSTLERKLAAYREGGFEALARKRRSDRGRPRRVPPEVIATAVAAKKEQPLRSDETINRILEDRHGVTVPRSTLYRHLKDAGATRIKLGITKTPVRKRWTREHTHDLWLGDFEEGPYVADGDDLAPTHLSAFIDCHSRYIVEGRYYFSQRLDILIDSWLRALAVHGAPLVLYLDNAKVYHAKGLKAACYRLNVDLLHRPPHDPAPGGLIERFFGTVQSQFEAEVRAGDVLTLETLNRAFSAWLEVSYHRRINSDTGQTPKERYDAGLTVIRTVDLNEARASFLERTTRRVSRDFSDISLHKRCYRVDRKLRGEKVEVRYDPFSGPETIEVYSLREEYLGQGILHARETGERPPPSAVRQRKPEYDYPELLIRKHDEQLRKETHGIDYRPAVQRRAWPFHAFVKVLARLMGRTGGLGAFTGGEMEKLKKLYNCSTAVSEVLLKEAFRRADEKTIPYIAYELQQLLREQCREQR